MQQFEKDMQSPHRLLFEEARGFLLAIYGIAETRKPRITTYSNVKGGICHLRTMPHGVDIGFLKGARMDDRHGRLSGDGKAVRVLSLETFEPATVRYYVEQAIALNG
ncbi:MAG: hypothetical protein JJ920_05500 [Roseitalea sp.]|jgi:hypothetical protein|nr:hypothetical protein [Roseitalea sp.]MBO6722570.1 hypothetical protein [Roseitalea sp.]MBO6742345.1 hypothetical protein [Roseitalea sp.]